MQSDDKLTMRRLEDKPGTLRRREIAKSEQYDYDDTNTFDTNNTLYRAIGVGIAIGAGIVAYKSGILKPVVKELLKATHTFAEQSVGDFSATYGAIRRWANLTVGTAKEAYRNPNRYTTLKNSIFRTTGKNSESNPRKILNVIKETLESGDMSSFRTGNASRILRDTIDDLKNLNKMIESNKTRMRRSVKSIDQSELITHMHEINQAMELMKRTGRGTIELESEFAKGLYEAHSVSDKKIAQQLKESGYRYLKLGDIFEEVREDGIVTGFKQKEGVERFLNVMTNNEDATKRSFERKIYNSLTVNGGNIKFVKDGKIMSMFGSKENEGFWKDLVIDSRVMTNGLEGEKMDIINAIVPRESLAMVWDSLKTDFKIPLVGFNPIKTISRFTPRIDAFLSNTPYDNIHFTLSNGSMKNPFVTGNANDTISEWAEREFGKEFEDALFIGIGHKGYVTSKSGKLKLVGDDFNIYDVTNSQKAYYMPYEVNAVRQMAGYRTDPEGFDINMAYREYLNNHPEVKDTLWNKFKYKTLFQKLHIGAQEPMFEDEVAAGFDEVTNIDELFNKIIGDKIIYNKKIRPVGQWYKDYEEMTKDIKNISYLESMGIYDRKYVDPKYGSKIRPREYYYTRRGTGIGDIIKSAKENGFNSEITKDKMVELIGQYGSGLDKEGNAGAYFTEKTTRGLWQVANILDQGLAHIHLGLAPQDKRNAWSYVGNLMLRRALPVFMLTQIPGMVEWLSEPFFTNIDRKKHEGDEEYDDRPRNITQWAVNHIVRPIDVASHQVMDITGATKFFKRAGELIPGIDQIEELPGIHALGLGQTMAEREDYIIRGYDPVRKGRYWSSGNTPFTGGKIEYWRPNLYRRINADVKFSGSKYGSRQEYYENTWYPNIVNPFAPIKHFITDRHHWDDKHYYDRPYLVHSTPGSNIPWIGPIIDAVGRPFQGKMHKEYWDNGRPIEKLNDEEPGYTLKYGISKNPDTIAIKTNPILELMSRTKRRQALEAINNEFTAKSNADAIAEMSSRSRSDRKRIQEMIDDAAYQAKQVVSNNVSRDSSNKRMQYREIITYDTPEIPKPNEHVEGDYVATKMKEQIDSVKNTNPFGSSILPERDYDRYGTPLEIYTTPSGKMKIVDVPDDMNLYKVNKELKHLSINNIHGTNQRIDINDYSYPGMPVGNDDKKIDNYFKYSIGDTYEQFGDVFGLRGFIVRQFVTGKANQRGAVIESSGYSYSSANDFWNMNLGGFGGELSEIGRRFIPQKNKHIEYINPIRNTQPNWMPGRNYFIDFLHGDPYTAVPNGEERIAGEGYERLNNINLSLGVDISQVGKSREELVKHFLHQDEYKSYDERQAEKALKGKSQYLNEYDEKGVEYRKYERKKKKHEKEIGDAYKFPLHPVRIMDNINALVHGYGTGNDDAINTGGKIVDKRNNITGKYDATVVDMKSPTGESNVIIRPLSHEDFQDVKRSNNVRALDYSQINYQMWATSNGINRGYVRYFDTETDEMYERKVKFNKAMLNRDMEAIANARADIQYALANNEIGRGELYPILDRFRILADVAPYSQEFKDVSAMLSQSNLTTLEQQEAKEIRQRMKEQKKPLRVYPYKFSTAKTKSETVTVREVLDNNTFITEEYGTEHAIKFAGMNVSESSSELYNPHLEKYRDKRGTVREHKVAKYTKKEAAAKMIGKYVKPGSRVQIEYDADPEKKFSDDSTQSIRAVISSRRIRNLNKKLLDMGLANEKENDDSAAGIRARYSSGEIAFGSAMETITHKGVPMIPFVGQKIMQVRSPYESYREREVYGKDFQSWNTPIRDIFIPNMVDRPIADNRLGGIFPIVMGAFIGSFFGNRPFGKMIGMAVGAGIPLVGKIAVGITHHDRDRDWRPKRRVEQEDINTYMDMLKYVKNLSLYNKYSEKALKEDNFDVSDYENEKKLEGEERKARLKELKEYKRSVKLDFSHHKRFEFEHGSPKYVEDGMSKKEVVSAINKEMLEIQSDRKVEKVPLNAIKAIAYKQEAMKTMYAYEPGSDLSQFMSALPKKDRNYFQYFVDAPQQEKDKILRITPNYMRRALQFAWGKDVDSKESLNQYFTKHALPDEKWEGWREDASLDDVKVKVVNKMRQDPGEFNIWDDDKVKADSVNIPVPRVNHKNSEEYVNNTLRNLLGTLGCENVQIMPSGNSNDGNSVDISIGNDERNDIEERLKRLSV